jgi:hypothetical protein
VLRTDVLARLLVERLNSTGPMTEAGAIEAIEYRAPGRGPDVILWAQRRGVIRRVQTDDAVMLEAVGTPQLVCVVELLARDTIREPDALDRLRQRRQARLMAAGMNGNGA